MTLNDDDGKDDAGYGLDEPAPKPKSADSKPMDTGTFGHRAAAPVKKSSGAEWSEWKGLRDAFISLLLRSVIAMIVWAAIVWATTPAMLWLRDNASGRQRIVTGIIGLAGGAAIGFILSRGLTERAGFVSPILTILVCIAVIVCASTGSILGSLPHGDVAFTLFPSLFAIGVGCGLAVFKTIMDE